VAQLILGERFGILLHAVIREATQGLLELFVGGRGGMAPA
jgi:hypothetical protein